MTVYFCNNTPLDIAAATIMGVNAKAITSPIGHFGTGLKYAIAVLLRTGHSVVIRTAGKTYKFGLKPRTIRDKVFQVVHMNNTALAYTTELGKNWSVWMAYRELRSNAMDEGEHEVLIDDPEAFNWATVISVSGPEIDAIATDSHGIFLEGDPLQANSSISIHSLNPASSVFYRRIRAMDLKTSPTKWTWNITRALDLTEDRTIKHSSYVDHEITNAIVTLTDPFLLEQILLTDGHDWYEHQINLDWHINTTPSAEFMEFVASHKNNPKLWEGAHGLWRSRMPEPDPEEIDIDEHDERMLRKARAIAKLVDPDYEDAGVHVVGALPNDAYACVRNGKTYVTRKAINQGSEFLATTLLEEYMHAHLGMSDETRQFQEHQWSYVQRLLQRFVTIV